MIVKRVTEAFHRQDWAAVAIEFVLVLVGVLLAFQINEWASERHDRAERAAATMRLLAEAEQDVAYFRREVAEHDTQVADLGYALDRLQEGSWREADRDRMQSGLTAALYLDSPAPPSSVYEDIVAAGMLGKIGDPSLRSAISNYRAKLALLSRLIDYIRQTAPRFDRENSLHYVYDAKGMRPARLEVDFQTLTADRRLQSTLALLDDRQAFIAKTWRETLAAAETMCRELGRNLRRRCEIDRAAV